ncbi:DUF1648 domain-containing protein [Hymenobacter psychrophilus]|nr:DUF1648 domain-containing protein [Hymenobacter psychrophilus]
MQDKAPATPRYSLVMQLLVFLPLACLIVWWPKLPASVPVHFTSEGADYYAHKHMLFIYVLLPALIYHTAPYLDAENQRRSLIRGVALFLSFVLSVTILAAAA